MDVFDIFLSHNSADKPAVENIAHKLKSAGLEPWLDKWYLVPEKPFKPASRMPSAIVLLAQYSSAQKASATGRAKRFSLPKIAQPRKRVTG